MVSDCISSWSLLIFLLLQEELEKVQKMAARFVTGNYIYETGSMTGILEQLKWESLKKGRRDSRIIIFTKVWRVQPVYLRMTLSPQLGMSEIITLWHFKPHLLVLTFSSAVSSPKLLEIRIHLQILSFRLLKVQKIMLLSSLFLEGLGTNFPHHRSWWMIVIWTCHQ